WTQNFRNKDRSVRLLVVFQNRHKSSADRKSGPVKRMNQVGAASALLPKTDIGAPCLKIFKVAARRDFPVCTLPRQPYFDIVCLGCGKTQVAGAKHDDAVMDSQ